MKSQHSTNTHEHHVYIVFLLCVADGLQSLSPLGESGALEEVYEPGHIQSADTAHAHRHQQQAPVAHRDTGEVLTDGLVRGSTNHVREPSVESDYNGDYRSFLRWRCIMCLLLGVLVRLSFCCEFGQQYVQVSGLLMKTHAGPFFNF